MRHFRKVEVVGSNPIFGSKPWKHNWTCSGFVIRRLRVRLPHKAPRGKDQALVVQWWNASLVTKKPQVRFLPSARRKDRSGIVAGPLFRSGVLRGIDVLVA